MLENSWNVNFWGLNSIYLNVNIFDVERATKACDGSSEGEMSFHRNLPRRNLSPLKSLLHATGMEYDLAAS